MLLLLTKDWRLLVGTEIVVGKVKHRAELVTHEVDKSLTVAEVNKAIGKHPAMESQSVSHSICAKE